jgi:hypothetical protein
MTAVCPDTPVGASGGQHPSPSEERSYVVLASVCVLPVSL